MTHDDSDRAERRRGGTRLCAKLSAEVAAIAPPGIGSWDRAWEIAADADTAFMLALTRWEATGDDAHKPGLRAAYFNALTAWREAVTAFTRHQHEAER